MNLLVVANSTLLLTDFFSCYEQLHSLRYLPSQHLNAASHFPEGLEACCLLLLGNIMKKSQKKKATEIKFIIGSWNWLHRIFIPIDTTFTIVSMPCCCTTTSRTNFPLIFI